MNFLSSEEGAWEEAIGHVDFNVLGSLPNMGPRAPLVVVELDSVDPELLDEDPDHKQVNMDGKTWVTV